MTIKIKLNLPIQRLAGNKEEIEVAGTTVKQCLDELVRRVPGASQELYLPDGTPALLMLLNFEPLPNQNLDHSVQNGDELWLLSIVSGG